MRTWRAMALACVVAAWSAGAHAQMPLTPKDPAPGAMGGRLVVRAVQGTPGGEPITGAEVRVDLMHRGTVLDSITATLDESGQAVLEGLPISAGFEPVATVSYAGVSYLQRGQAMGPADPTGEIDVVCYEVTSEEPAWEIEIRHVMLVRDREGIRVTEIVRVVNPESRTWLGRSEGYEKPSTTSLVLPESASDVSLGEGFHGWCCTTVEGRRLINHLPLMPGMTEMTFGYRIRSMGKETPLS